MADERELVALLKEKEEEIRTQVPSWLDKDRFMAANYELRYQWLHDENLKKCTNESLVNCVYESARTGLEFAAKHAYVVAYGTTATFMPGYRGKIFLKVRSGAVKLIVPDIVYEKDDFTIERDSSNPEMAHLVHRYARGDRGKPVQSYALAKLISGEVDFEVCSFDRIERSRKKSKQPEGMMWGTFWEEGWKKTPIHILDKRLPEGINTEAVRAYRLATTLEVAGQILTSNEGHDPGELSPEETPRARVVVKPDEPIDDPDEGRQEDVKDEGTEGMDLFPDPPVPDGDYPTAEEVRQEYVNSPLTPKERFERIEKAIPDFKLKGYTKLDGPERKAVMEALRK